MTTVSEQIQQIYIGLLGRAADQAGLDYWAAEINGGALTLEQLRANIVNEQPEYAAGQGSMTRAQAVADLYENLFNRQPEAAGLEYWVNGGGASVNIDQLVLALIAGASAADQLVLDNKTEVAEYYTAAAGADYTADAAKAAVDNVDATRGSVDAAKVAIDSGTVASGQTFMLTAGIDNKTGTPGADTFDASLVSGVQTLGSADKLDGGAGSDTLIATLNTASAISPTLTSIENIQVVDTAGATLNLQNATGVESIIATGSARTTFNNIASTAVALEVSGNNQGANFNFVNSALAGTADEVTVKLNGVNDTTNAQINVTQAAGTDTTGAETVVIDSTGSANRVAQVTSENAATTDVLKTLKVTGDQALTINTALGTTTTTVDASGQTAGGVTAEMKAGAAKFIGGAGNDAMSFTTNAGDVSVSGGAGNDSFTFGGTTQTLTNADTIDGGEGTDTIVAVSADLVAYTKATTATITNVEAVKVSDTLGGNVTLSNLGAGINSIELADGTDGTQRTITFASGSNTATLSGSANAKVGTAGVKFAVAGNGVADAVTINVTDAVANAGAGVFDSKALAVDGAETITINATKAAQTIGGITLTNTMAAAQTVNFGGGYAIDAGTISATTGTLAAINASAMTVATTAAGLSATAGSATAMTGSGGKDNLTGSSGKDTINGGAGNDTIASGGGNDVIDGGDGDDSITLNAASTTASINGGAGNDTITVSGQLAKGQTIAGGAGTDTLVINSTDVSTFNDLTSAEKATLKGNITGIEVLQFAANTGAALDVSTLVNTAEVTTYKFAADQTNQIDNVASGSTLELTSANSSFTATVKDAATSTSDVITYKYTNASDTNFGTQTITNVETINVVSNDADPTAGGAETHTVTIAADSVVGALNISGDNNLVLTVSGATKLATTTVTSTGTLNLDVSASTVANTITLGSGDTVLVSGIGADSITGGIGNDSIDAGSGNDTVIGGAGNDTINGGAGSDSLSGGSGNDVFLTSAGTDTIDGGDGTDTLRVSSAVFNNISSINLTSVETLDMNNLAATMTIAQFGGFTTISNASGGVVFADAGSITGKAAVNSYTLANGTNTFTAATPSSGQVSVLGGTGADTFNFTVAQVATNTTIKGGTGADVLNFTNNAAVSLTSNAISDVEKIVFNNTDTNISFTTGDSMQAENGTTTIEVDASNLTSGTFVFDASAEDDGTFGFKVLKGGTGAATITGSSGADTILGGSGADTITGGAGNDSIDLSSGGADKVIFSTAATNGIDVITGFSSDDAINVEVLGSGNISSEVVIAAPAGQGAFTDAAAYVITTDGTAASLTTSGDATLAAADFTAGTLTNLAAFLSERFTTTASTTDGAVVINFSGNNTTYVYSYVASATDNTTVDANELTLVGVISNGGSALGAANVDFTA